MYVQFVAIVTSLEKYVGSEKMDLNLSAIVKEARLLRNNIKELDSTDNIEKAEKILRFVILF